MHKFIISLSTIATLTLAAIPVLGLAQAAHAAEPEVRIALGDLNLAKPEQAARFKVRVQTAADTLCSTTADADLRRMSRNFCINEVQREVSRQLSSRQRQDLQIAARSKGDVKFAAQ